MSAIPERFIWATDLLNVLAEDQVLEIGCGTGILAEQIASKLTSGQLTAIDRSALMIEKARKRNSGFTESGISKFLISEFPKMELPEAIFDKAVAFNVNFFWKNPAKELQLIKQVLKKDGKLFVFYQAPFEINSKATGPIKQKLIENSFEVLEVHLKKLLPTSAFCIISKPLRAS